MERFAPADVLKHRAVMTIKQNGREDFLVSLFDFVKQSLYDKNKDTDGMRFNIDGIDFWKMEIQSTAYHRLTDDILADLDSRFPDWGGFSKMADARKHYLVLVERRVDDA